MTQKNTQKNQGKKLKPKYNVIALTGPQGSGKTTQLKLLLEKIDAEFASVGEILRTVTKDSEREDHKMIREIMAQGKLQPEEVTLRILKEYFAEKREKGETKEVLIFDGFPRTALQTEHLYELADSYHGGNSKIAIARMLLDHEQSMKRCLDRVESVLKEGGTPRADDTPEAIKQRLSIYFDSVPHLDKKFDGRAHVHEFHGHKQRDQIHDDMLDALFEKDPDIGA